MYYSHKYINELREVFDNLSNIFNGADIQCSEISSLSLLDSAKASISKMNSEVINDLKTNIDNVTNTMKENDENVKMLFDYMDNGETLGETTDIGDYMSEGNINIMKLQEDYLAQVERIDDYLDELQLAYEKKDELFETVNIMRFWSEINSYDEFINNVDPEIYDYCKIKWKEITGEELILQNDEDLRNIYNVVTEGYDAYVNDIVYAITTFKNIRTIIEDNVYKLYMGYDDFKENIEFKNPIAPYDSTSQYIWADDKGNPIDPSKISDYEYIFIRETNDALSDSTSNEKEHTYYFMTEEERNIAKYLYNTGKTEELDNYFRIKTSYANQRHGEEMAAEVIDEIKSYYKNYDYSTASVYTETLLLGQGIFDGINNFFAGFGNLVSADGIPSAKQYKSALILEKLNDEVYGDEIEDKIFKHISIGNYEISSSIGNMAPSILASTICNILLPGSGVYVGTVLMGASATGNAREEGLQEGMTTGGAWIYGILSGASEAGLQYILGGIGPLSRSNNLLLGSDKKLVASLFKECLSEGTEEAIQELLNPLFKSMVTGDAYEVDVAAVLKAGLYGMITAGILNGGEIVINSNFKCDLSVLPKEKRDAVLAAISTEFAGLDMTNIENQQILMDTLRTYGLTIEEISLNPDTKTKLFNIVSSIRMKIESIGYDTSDMSITEIMKNYPDIYTETLSEYGISESVHKSFILNDIIGQDLYSWVPNIDTANTLFNNLQTACDNAGIDIYDPIVLKSLTTLDAFKEYYVEARSIVENNNNTTDPNEIVKDAADLETYRTHGVIHIIDVMTQSINCYSAFSKAGINGLDLETITLAAIMHDTGMSGGLEIKINEDTNTIEVNSATKNAKTYRESHSYNSGVNTLENYQKLQEIGYTDLQIAEASLLAFAHSKSNSGLSPLSNNASGWSFALDALAIASEQGNFGFDIIGVLEEAGIVSTSNSSNQSVKVKTPTQGKLEFEYHEYEFNQEWLTKMAYEGLILRIGDAATNNDNGMTNQFGDVITIIDDYSNQIDITTLSSTESMVNLIKENIKNNLKKEIGKNEWEALSKEEQTRLINEEYNTKYKDDIINLNLDSLSQSERTIQLMKYLIDEKITLETLAEVEASDLSFSVGETEMSKSQQFVLGEHNQTYRVETNQDGNVDMIISVKESEAVPFCTLFAIEERLGELNSKGNGIFSAASDGKEIKLIIEIDESTSHNITYLYEQFANYYSASDTSGKKVNIEIRMVNRK